MICRMKIYLDEFERFIAFSSTSPVDFCYDLKKKMYCGEISGHTYYYKDGYRDMFKKTTTFNKAAKELSKICITR